MSERLRELLAANKAKLEAIEAERRSGMKLDDDALRELAVSHKEKLDALHAEMRAQSDKSLSELTAANQAKLKATEAERSTKKRMTEIRKRLSPILGEDLGFQPDSDGDPSKFILNVDMSRYIDAGLLTKQEALDAAAGGEDIVELIEEAEFILSNRTYFLQILSSRQFWFIDGRPNHEKLEKQLLKDFGQEKFGLYGEFGPRRQHRLFPLVYRFFGGRSDEKARSTAIAGSLGEQIAQKLFEAMGYHATRTPEGPDQGVDLMLEKDGQRYVAQVKNYSEPVGNAAVQEAIAGREFMGAAGAFVVSFSGFTKSAEELARTTQTNLIDFREIERQFWRMLK